MSTAQDALGAIAQRRHARPFPAHRAVGQASGMTRIVARTPLWSGPLIATIIRLGRPTRRRRSPHGTR